MRESFRKTKGADTEEKHFQAIDGQVDLASGDTTSELFILARTW